MKQCKVAVVGAMGVVGSEMIKTLEQRKFPLSELVPLDTSENEGKSVKFNGKDVPVQVAKKGAFVGIDIAIFSAGAGASKVLAPMAVEEGAIVVDNSSEWRMNPEVPLVIPEVNKEALREHKGIIANPNCSTIQMLVALKPLHDLFKIKRVVVSTYQAISGGGGPAIAEMANQAKCWAEGSPVTHTVYPKQIMFNVLPQIDIFLEDGYTKEEMKMVHETHKIMDPEVLVCPTAVRVPVFRGHSESINIEMEKPCTVAQARDIFSKAAGITLVDDFTKLEYPTPLEMEGQDDVFVGRLREDKSVTNGLNLWVVADNVRKGAALNAVQIAETLISLELV
ncbi:aspartate-semialdehyde dehydrogenase [Oceanispirochaeta crateris]|jgi:aspartate-semialdehyde dehydrogenase|uniref:Aspartate-semialdehyde dehydrogenase n=1 Tax=Oceanispirochaeta crateris TaxID=2518645 RepID=A0A5C1QUB5_9SPIO|nr:aspartate-semialdehyde dehydrogenase [Oceanispirochaeta crateris]QEN09652.1 aspartate-semialdehyde dehydrogenase [Oceanispirochaeta crateris]